MPAGPSRKPLAACVASAVLVRVPVLVATPTVIRWVLVLALSTLALVVVHRASAWRAVAEALTERVAGNVDEYRALTMARLEKLLASHWIDATEHADTKAADLVLKVMAQQVKLMGLDQPRQAADQVQTLVIGGTSAEYVAALQQVVSRTAQLSAAEGYQERNERP
jgi:hypothetical protein